MPTYKNTHHHDPPEEHLFEESVGGAHTHRAVRVEAVQLQLRRDNLCGLLSVSCGASPTAAVCNNHSQLHLTSNCPLDKFGAGNLLVYLY